jgi:hypothetical protein
MAMPSSKQSTTTADTIDTSECHTLCPYLQSKGTQDTGSELAGCRLAVNLVLHLLRADNSLPCCCCAERVLQTRSLHTHVML